MVRMRCGMGMSDALALWKWRISFVVERTLLLENRMESLFTEGVTCLIVTSCDIESIDKFVCERKWSVDSVVFSWSPPITWVWERNHANLLFLDFLISFHSASLLYQSHRLALESHNCNHHHSFPFSSYLIQSIASFPSTQLIPIHHNDPSSIKSTISTLVSSLFTMQWSILMYNPMHKSISLNWNECLFFHSYSLSLFYPNNHNPSSHSKSHTDSSPVRQWETSKSYPTIDTQTNPYHTQSIYPHTIFP